MDLWGHSSFGEKIVSWFIEDGLLRLVMNATQPEWIVPGNKDEPNPTPSVVTSSASRTFMNGGSGRL
jgi:hypothetical protein